MNLRELLEQQTNLYEEHSDCVVEEGLSAYKMNALKKSLIKKGHVVQFSINIGKSFGGKITLLALTGKGYKAIGKRPVLKPDNISWEHWWWQRAICDYFNRWGAKAEIEKAKNGTRADVGLAINGNRA